MSPTVRTTSRWLAGGAKREPAHRVLKLLDELRERLAFVVALDETVEIEVRIEIPNAQGAITPSPRPTCSASSRCR